MKDGIISLIVGIIFIIPGFIELKKEEDIYSKPSNIINTAGFIGMGIVCILVGLLKILNI